MAKRFQLGKHHLKESKFCARIDELFMCLMTGSRWGLEVRVDEIWMLQASAKLALASVRHGTANWTYFLNCMSALFMFVFFTFILVGTVEDFAFAAF